MKIYNVVCSACFQLLGRTYKHHADHLAEVHMKKCPASAEAKEEAIANLVIASVTGDTSSLWEGVARKAMEQ